MDMRTDFDLCVIGGGSAGLTAAAGAAALGAKVALVERRRLGGGCQWPGCVPSKALLYAAQLAHHARLIYACGDVTGRHLFTHSAEHQAGVVLRNALFRLPAKVERRAMPWCTYSDPEVARVGVAEHEAVQRGIDHRVYTFPFRDIDRAHTDGATAGFAKLITEPNGRLLGATLVGAHAGELIHEYVLALAKGMKAGDVSSGIHIYPTLAQINRRVADQRLKAQLTPRVKKWLKFIFRLRGA